MAGRINDVDMRTLVLNRAVFSKDGNAALFFKVIGVHHAGIHLLIFAEGAGLPQQLVHQRGFAVVNVGNDGDVAQSAVSV